MDFEKIFFKNTKIIAKQNFFNLFFLKSMHALHFLIWNSIIGGAVPLLLYHD